MSKSIDSIIQGKEDVKLNKYLESLENICDKCKNNECPYDYDVSEEANIIDEIQENGICEHFKR